VMGEIAVWNPNKPIGGVLPALWYDASQLTGLADDDLVSTWTDNGSMAKNLTSALDARPKYKVNVFGTKPAILFDAIDDYMANAGIDFSATYAQSIFYVIKPVVKASINVVTDHGSLSTDGNYIYHGTDGKMSAVCLGDTGTSYHTHGSVIDGTGIYVSTLLNKAGDTDTCIVYVNGVTSGTPIIVNNTNAFGNRVFNVGKRANNTGWFSGYIAEILIYKKLMSSAERLQVEKYLTNKYFT